MQLFGVFFYLVIGLLSSKALYAQDLSFTDPFGSCDEQRVAVIFVNGITTSDEETQKSRYFLESIIASRVRSLSLNEQCFFVSQFYNDSYGLANDLIESVELGIQQEQWNPLWRFVVKVADTFEETVDAFITPDVAEVFGIKISDRIISTTEADLQIDAFVSAYLPAISELVGVHGAQKVILVDHSQGNWLGNALYLAYAGNEISNILGLVGVAVPSDRIEPSFDIATQKRYTTNYRDVIKAIPDGLPANTPVTGGGACDDATSFTVLKSVYCHGFKRYMQIPELRDSIVDDIFAVAGYGDAPTPQKMTDFLFDDARTRQVVEIGSEVVMSASRGGVLSFQGYVVDQSFLTGEAQNPNIWASSIGLENVGDIVETTEGIFFLAGDNGFRSVYRIFGSQVTQAFLSTHALQGIVQGIESLQVVDDQLIAIALHTGGKSLYVPSGFGQIFTMRPLDDISPIQFVPTTDISLYGDQIVVRSSLDDYGRSLFFIDRTSLSQARILPLDGSVGSFASTIDAFVIYNGRIYFTLSTFNGVSGHSELWWTDGTHSRYLRDLAPLTNRMVLAGERLFLYGKFGMTIYDINNPSKSKNFTQDSRALISSAMNVGSDVYMPSYNQLDGIGTLHVLRGGTTEIVGLLNSATNFRALTEWKEVLYVAVNNDLLRISGNEVVTVDFGDEVITKANTILPTKEHIYVDAKTIESGSEVWRLE